MPWQPMHIETLSRAASILPLGASPAAARPAAAQEAVTASADSARIRWFRNFILALDRLGYRFRVWPGRKTLRLYDNCRKSLQPGRRRGATPSETCLP